MIVYLIVNIIFDKSRGGINYSDINFQRYDVIPFVKYIEPEPPPSNLVLIENGETIQPTNGL